MATAEHRIVHPGRRGPVRLERCFEPIAQCLTRMLMLPRIYFQRAWPPPPGGCYARVDIVAIDRDGTGDVHVVEVKRTLGQALSEGIEAIRDVPAHYRWVAYQGEGLTALEDRAEMRLLSERPLLPKSGMGRIGVIEVVRMTGLNLGARIRVKAERFDPGDIYGPTEQFVRKENANWQFRE